MVYYTGELLSEVGARSDRIALRISKGSIAGVPTGPIR